jgi:sugar-specific transcriptional regulator TrmB
MALLQVENDSVLDLAKRTKINRTTIYPVLESLAKKGLISEMIVENKTRYQAEAPERLETYVERQKVNLEEQAKRLHSDIVPMLKSVQREPGERPVVRFLEGREGIISATESFLRSAETGGMQYMIYSRDLVEKLFPDKERAKFVNARINKDITAKAIYTYTKGELTPHPKSMRLRIDETKYPIKCDISSYNDKVKISILGEKPSGIVITSKDFAETLASMISYIYDHPDK